MQRLMAADDPVKSCTELANSIPSEVAVGTMLQTVKRCRKELQVANDTLADSTMALAKLQLRCKHLMALQARNRRSASVIFHTADLMAKKFAREEAIDYDDVRALECIQELSSSM